MFKIYFVIILELLFVYYKYNLIIIMMEFLNFMDLFLFNFCVYVKIGVYFFLYLNNVIIYD